MRLRSLQPRLAAASRFLSGTASEETPKYSDVCPRCPHLPVSSFWFARRGIHTALSNRRLRISVISNHFCSMAINIALLSGYTWRCSRAHHSRLKELRVGGNFDYALCHDFFHNPPQKESQLL